MTLFHPFVLDNAAGQETVVGVGSDSEKYGVGISSDFNVTGSVGIGTTIPDKTFVVKGSGGNFVGEITNTGTSVDNNGLFVTTANDNSSTILFAASSGGSEKFRISATGGLGINGANYGSSGQILSSTGSGLNWIDASTTSVANANNVGTNDASSTNSTHYLAFLGATSGNNPVRIDTSLQYNPSSGTITHNSNNSDPSHDTGAIIIQPSTSGGKTGITFRSNVNSTSDHGYLWWYDDNDNYNTSTAANSENGVLVLGVQNDAADAVPADNIAVESTGNIFLNPGISDNLSGGTSGPNFTNGKVYIGTKTTKYQVWHEGNDGSSSGLNADKLDDVEGDSFLRSDDNDTMTGQLTMSRSGDNQIILNRNITSVSNYYTGLQLEIRATDGTAGIALHRNGYSHVGIYHDSLNQVKFHMNGGITTLNHNTGTVWGSGNDGPSSGLNADKLDDVEGDKFLRKDSGNTVTSAGLTNFVQSFIAEAVVKDDITTRTAGGFFETNTATLSEGWPEDSNNWFHLLNSTHSNGSNYYSMQFAGNFFNQNIYHRNTNNNGSQTWSKVWTEATDGPGSGLHADIVEGISKSGTLNDYSSLTSSSFIMMGNTFGSVFRLNYDNHNQRMTMQTGDSSTRNYGNIKIRSGRGGLSNSIYASNSGSSIIISHNDGDTLIGSSTGNFNLSGASGDHRGFLVALDGSIEHTTVGSFGIKMIKRSAVGDFKSITFQEPGGSEIGSVTVNHTSNTTSFNETSDYRIKENVVGITSALDKINQLRPVNFNFIGKSVKLDGFLAHEVQAVIPYAVSGEKDAVKTVKDGDLSNDGSKEDAERIAALPTKEVPDLQQLDKSKLITLLTASVQELSAKNDALEARIKALESS